jgi:predicted nucleotidyltransferase
MPARADVPRLAPVHQAFTRALDALGARIQEDRTILAAILCGSLSHDAVWARSDIDLVLVTIDDKKTDVDDASLYADGLNVHAFLLPRAGFRRIVEGSTHNSFMHSFLAKGRLLYSHDPTIADLCERLHTLGTRDASVQLLRAATHALSSIYKAHKWFVTRADLDYTALWILYAATGLAQIEVLSAGQLVDREVIPQAMKINRPFFDLVYTGMLNARKTPQSVHAALDAVDGYIAARTESLFALVLDYLRDAAEARSSKEIEDHFRKNYDASGVTIACEYLADRGVIAKASTPVHLTKRSNVEVQELAFFLPD